MGNYGIKIAKSGYGITESSPGNYIFHSSYPLLKIKGIYEGHTYAATGAERLIAQINHSLGYAPMFNVMIGKNSSESTPTTWYPSSRYILYPTLGTLHYMKVYSDTTYLYIYSFRNDGNEYVYYKAAIYYDPINP